MMRYVLLIGLLVLAFFYKLTFTDLILARGDTFAYFYPYWDARDAAILSGTLPLWSPDLFMGVPLLANSQIGTFYPPNWLTLTLPAPDAVRVSILIHAFWAALGAFWLARRTLGVSYGAALIAGAIFAFSGFVGAHVEQINQLQGLAWMPHLFLLLDYARTNPARYVPPLGIAWGLQLLTGHTQTVFITGAGLGLYALFVAPNLTRPDNIKRLSALAVIGGAAIIAVIIASPQLIPTQELISVSNRGDGLNRQEATAFSLDPLIIGRGLLPSYAGQPFGEYVAYLGVIGLGLAVVGALTPTRRRWVWLALAGVGFFLALGRHNPLYYEILSGAPGFNLFRVPARWMALFALGGAMLAGIGAEALFNRSRNIRSVLAVAGGLMAILAAWSFLAESGPERITGPAQPTAITLALWGAAALTFGLMVWRPARVVIIGAVIIELWIASNTLPYNDLADPAVYRAPRFTISQLRALTADEIAPGRLLSISRNEFDPGDKPVLEARWERLGMGTVARDHAFTAVKLGEVIAFNLPLTWGIPTIDGFDGGVLPTLYYTDFTSLLLPEGALRAVDGRLRERLALPECRGACLPESRWLDFTATRYLLVDKVYDVVHDGVFFDTTFETALNGDPVTFANVDDFIADRVHLLIVCDADACPAPDVAFDDSPLNASNNLLVQNFTIWHYETESAIAPERVTISGDAGRVVAVSLADSRTGDFVGLVPSGWRRIYSAEVKIYENLNVLPRAFVVWDVATFPDTWDGKEAALNAMRDPAFDPARQAVAITDSPLTTTGDHAPVTAQIIEYTPTRVVVSVDVPHDDGLFILTDAYYPGWRATVNGESAPIIRANSMFRGVQLESGEQMIAFTYNVDHLAWIAVLAWGVLPLSLIAFALIRRRVTAVRR